MKKDSVVTTYPKLNNQPLKFALAEVRFSKVLQISKFIPELQEAFRKKYPAFMEGREPAVQIQGNGIDVSELQRWAFMSADKKSAIGIDQERLIYATSDYPRFQGFSDTCLDAIRILEKIVEPGLVHRIGLRYSDLILLGENESLSDLVDSHFGFSKNLSSLGIPRQQSTETYIQTKVGSLVIRTLYGTNDLTCLQDVKSLPISLDVYPEPSERIILDFDHFWESQSEVVQFESKEIINILSSLHETSREAFWAITTDYARTEKWA